MLIAKYGNGSIEQVEEFEKKYGINLDDCYRKFLIDYNGGETPNTILKKGKVSETVRYLYGLNVEQSIRENYEFILIGRKIIVFQLELIILETIILSASLKIIMVLFIFVTMKEALRI